MQTDLKTSIFQCLKKDKRIWVKSENKESELDKIKLLSLIDENDSEIIDNVFQNKLAKERFFIKVKDKYIFKRSEFRFFIEESQINSSYTRFKNKIGLTSSKKFISEGGDVVLDFPFKDCVLQGCQDKEDSKRDEKFLNIVLAADEVDRLFEPKALVNWKRYDRNGEHELRI